MLFIFEIMAYKYVLLKLPKILSLFIREMTEDRCQRTEAFDLGFQIGLNFTRSPQPATRIPQLVARSPQLATRNTQHAMRF